jgi:hypothetical protein
VGLVKTGSAAQPSSDGIGQASDLLIDDRNLLDR